MNHDIAHIAETNGTGIAKSPIMLIGLVFAIAIFLAQAQSLAFTQDDAFISYRYAQNALDGHGLVYNAGERVEGYTNFLWVICLIIAGKLGIGFDVAAKSLGIASGVGMIVLAALLIRHFRPTDSRLDDALAAVAAVWVASNGALAYWAVSGLETAFFGLLVSLSILLWLRRSRMVVVPIALSILARPEGGLFWILLGVAEWFRSKDKHSIAWHFAAVGVFLAPYAAFKLVNYGDLLPNPFYAKTGLSWEYLTSGMVYVWEFSRDYGLWGAIAIPMLALIRRDRNDIKPLIWILVIFTGYVMLVGGDVLRPHRFFVPILPVLASVGLIGLISLAEKWQSMIARWAVVVIVVLWAGVGWLLTPDSLHENRRLEMALTDKMSHVAQNLRGFETGTFTVAATTIGRLGYDLPECRIIDMLGLTDREIAHNPESTSGIGSSWKERKFNAGYVLQQQPEYILFSTGYKPSAPAERALILHSRFRRNYFGFVSYDGDRPLPAYRRKSIDSAPDEIWPDIGYPEIVNEAFNLRMAQDQPRIAQKFIEAHHSGPGDFGILLAFAAHAFQLNGDPVRAMAYADSAIAVDSFTVEAWRVKSTVSETLGDTGAVRLARQQLASILRSAR